MMKNFNKIWKAALLLLSFVIAVPVSAQINTPYSMYGYGIISDRASSMQNQMGGIGYAMQSGRQINVMNPASYASIDSLTFLFDMGIDVAMLWSREDKAREHTTGGGLDYVTMQFPITKWMGASVGLIPYSSVGYSFGNDVHSGTRQNQGSGGINQLYAGFGVQQWGISLGANIAYSFGTIVNDFYSKPASSGQTLFEHLMRVRDWDINIGMQYAVRIKKTERLTLGVTYSPKKTLLGTSLATTQEVVLDSRPDTVGTLNLRDHYYTPTSVGAGISWSHDRSSHWMIEADYTWQNWADAPYSPLTDKQGQVLFEGMQFFNRSKIAVGGEFTPNVRGNYGQRITYRLGAYYVEDYLNIRGNRIKEYGVTCGAGFPAPSGKTVVNVGFEWKYRRAYPAAMVQENYFNISLGVNFNELWFWQRKIK